MRSLCTAIVCVVASAAAHAATLAEWITFSNNGSIAATNLASGLTGIDLSRGGGLLSNTSGNTYNSRNWTTGGTLTNAVANNDYLQWGFTVAPGMLVDLTSLEIRYDRSDTGPANISILLLEGGFANTTQVHRNDSVSASGETHIIDLTDHQDLTGNIFFRVYGWNALTSSGTFDIEAFEDNIGIRINGGVTGIPAPGAVSVLGLAGLAATRRRR